jgi:HAD superfamily hydrolase (TIGR01509 family)
MMDRMVVIFDCDGVLVDSPVLGVQAEADCYSEAGIPTTAAAAMERFGGMSDADAVRVLEAETGMQLPCDMAERIDARKRELFTRSLAAIKGVHAALEGLRHTPHCVASSSSMVMIQHMLSLTKLDRYFDGRLYSAEMVDRGKPYPDLFLYAAEQMHAAPTDCVVVEDSIAGVRAGKVAGCFVIGFVGGSHCDEDQVSRLRDAHADVIISSMADLPAALPVKIR